MKRLSQEEIDVISRKYLTLKNKSNPSEDDVKEFKAYQNFCMGKFAYLVKMRSAKYRKFSNHPDLEQDGFEALILAFNTFDPDKGSFSWWADKYISTRISRAANAHSTIRYPIKKAKEIKPYKTSTIPIMIDEGPDPALAAEVSENSVNINRAIDSLPASHKSVVNMTYGFNGFRARTVGTVMVDLKITRSEYTKLLREAKEQIRQQLVVLK
jgi:RNA polymerase sigma factor (sigma-70 family)